MKVLGSIVKTFNQNAYQYIIYLSYSIGSLRMAITNPTTQF